jgi:hypothetical protein
MRGMQIAFGISVILIGILLLLATNGLLVLNATDVAGIALILSGLLFWVPGITWRRRMPWLTTLFIPGSLALATGVVLMYTGRAGLSEWRYLWTTLLIALGFAFLAMYFLGPRAHGLWIAGIVAGGVGALLLALFLSLFGAGLAARVIGPIVLIALGLVLAFSALLPRKH